MPNDKSARELSAHGGDGGGDKAIDLHNDLPTPDLLDEAERIAANQHKDGRYAAALVLRILCHRLAATQQPASGGPWVHGHRTMDDFALPAIAAHGEHGPIGDAELDAAREPNPLYAAHGGSGEDDIEVAEAALERALAKFTERQFVDPGTGYGEYNDRDEEYHADLVSALDAVKSLHDVPPDRRTEEFDHE